MSLTVTTNASVEMSSTDGDSQTVESYTSEFSASIGIAPDSSDVVLGLGGEATAVGDNTLALGSLEAELDATGAVTSAYGSATFIAAAESPYGETAFATANSYGFVTGMDFLAVVTSNTEIVQEGPDGSLWVATSETTFYGVDYDALATDGILSTNSSSSAEDDDVPATGDIDDPTAGDLSGSATDHSDEDWTDIGGNLALLDVDADVFGSDTLLLVEADVLTIENTLSTVIADLFAAVG